MVTLLANSGAFVRPAITRPAARNLDTRTESAGAGRAASFSRRLPLATDCPAQGAIQSFSRNGTPRNTLSGRGPTAVRRAWSNHRITTALICGSAASIRPIAASSSSSAVT